MDKRRPVILHFKWSLDDGHVTPQIFKVKRYKGILITREPQKVWKNSPIQRQILPLSHLVAYPRQIIKKYNVKAIHVHHATLASKLLFLKTQHKLPLIVGFRGKDATSYPKEPKNRKFLKKLFKEADLFFPVCHHLEDKIVKLGCPKDKIRVLYGGVDVDRFQYAPRIFPEDGPVRFLAVGRFVEKKGFGDLIEAFAKLKQKHPQVKLTLIGEGEAEKDYRKKIKKYGLERNVKILSWVNYQQIQKEYHRAHIFCAPSVTDCEGNQEGIPNTLKEAMATGMPCVATDHAGNGEILEDGVNGLLVPEGNVEKLAHAMVKMVEQPENWKEWGYQARKKIEEDFNQKKQLQKQKAYYDELIRQTQLKPLTI